MKNVGGPKTIAFVILLGFVLMTDSCSKSSDSTSSLSPSVTTNVSAESTSQSLTSEAADISNSVTSNTGNGVLSGSRMEKIVIPGATAASWDPRLVCATVTISPAAGSTKDNPQGTIIIYYDSTATCKDAIGVQRKGTINIAYSGQRFAIASTRVLTFQDYSRNGVKITGTYTISNRTDSTASAPLQYLHVLANGKLTFVNGKSITRNHIYTFVWTRGNTPGGDSFAIKAGSTATGSTEDGTSYSVNVSSDLTYTLPCLLQKIFIPVTGNKTLELGTSTYSINYGTGTCDNVITVSLGSGPAQSITLTSDGN